MELVTFINHTAKHRKLSSQDLDTIKSHVSKAPRKARPPGAPKPSGPIEHPPSARNVVPAPLQERDTYSWPIHMHGKLITLTSRFSVAEPRQLVRDSKSRFSKAAQNRTPVDSEVPPSRFGQTWAESIFNSVPLNVLGSLPTGLDSREMSLFLYSKTSFISTREDGSYHPLRDVIYPSAYVSPIVLQWLLISNERQLSIAKGSKECPPSIHQRKARVYRMINDALAGLVTSPSDAIIGAVAISVALDQGDDYPNSNINWAHVQGLALLLRNHGGLSSFHTVPWLVGLIAWALMACHGGVFHTASELRTSRTETANMLKDLHACNLRLAQQATTADTDNWTTYFSLRDGLFGPHSPFRPIIMLENIPPRSTNLAYHMPDDRCCQLVFLTTLNLLLWDLCDNPVAASTYLRNLTLALCTSTFVEKDTNKWRISIQMVCSILAYGGLESGRQGDGYKRECERTEKALRVLKFATATGEATLGKLIHVMLAWLFMEQGPGLDNVGGIASPQQV